MTTYAHPDRLLLAVDCIILGFLNGQLNILLVRRAVAPRSGEWALMGGLVYKNEAVDDAAARVTEELTGLEDVYLEQFHTFGAVARDEGDRIVSVAYYALVNQRVATSQLSEEYDARWVPITEVPSLVFDHNEMVDSALERLRYRATHEPVGFALLPERFTLTTLQALYESIFGRSIDPGNFRRRLRKMHYLERQDEKDVSTSRKGAWYYAYNEEAYAEAREAGEEFLLKP